MFEQFHLKLDVTIRLCERKDLLDLEWFGLFAHNHDLFLSAYERHEKGENIMLVAEVNLFPVGQIWIDLTKRKIDSIGVLCALRVMPSLHNLGIGSALIRSAESILQSKGYRVAELGVEKNNDHAKRLYEWFAYRVVGDNIEEWDYTTPQSGTVHAAIHEWIMHKTLWEDPAMSARAD